MNPAERSPVTQADAARSGSDLPHSQSGGPLLDTSTLPASDADRYALAFRPSWAPLLQEPQPTAAGAIAPPHKLHVDREQRDEPLLAVARKTRRRGGLLASASVLSFIGLVYWGVSSTTEPVPATHVAQRANAPQPIATAAHAPAASPEPSETPVPAAPSDLSALRARPPTPTDSPEPVAEAQDPTAQAAAAEPTDMAPTDTATAPALAESGALGTRAEPGETPPGDVPAAPTQPQEAVAAAAPSSPPSTAAPPTQPQPAAASALPLPAAAVPSPNAEPIAPLPAPASGSLAASAKPAPAASPSVRATAPQITSAPAQPSSIAMAQSARAAAPEVAPQHKRLPLLSVRALPEGARLFLDGQRLPNPFDMRLPEGGKHKLEARYEGYETSSQTVRIESDAKLTITLRHIGPSPAPQLQVRPLNQQPHTHGAGFVTSNPY